MTHSPRDAARSERRESMEAMRVQDMQARAKNAAGCKARGDALTRCPPYRPFTFTTRLLLGARRSIASSVARIFRLVALTTGRSLPLPASRAVLPPNLQYRYYSTTQYLDTDGKPCRPSCVKGDTFPVRLLRL